jgi:2-C-methyl-D-erythritol 4-phosphate cytidylyltransferase
VAGGSGTRFGKPKQYESLGDRRVVDWSLEVARRISDSIVLVVPVARVGDDEPLADLVVAGGDTRSESVRAGLAALPDDVTYVLVHDAARPVPLADVWQRVVAALQEGARAVVPVVPVTDTLRERDGGTVDRTRLVAVQTPQGFAAEVLRAAHAAGGDATDDAALAEAIGAKVVLVDGDVRNIKITDASDLALAEFLVRCCASVRALTCMRSVTTTGANSCSAASCSPVSAGSRVTATPT